MPLQSLVGSDSHWFSFQSILSLLLLKNTFSHFHSPTRTPSWLGTVSSSSPSQSIPIPLFIEPCFLQFTHKYTSPQASKVSLLAPVHTQIPGVWDPPSIDHSLTYPTAFSSTFLSNLHATHSVRPNSRPPSSGSQSGFPVHSPKWSWSYAQNQSQPCAP